MKLKLILLVSLFIVGSALSATAGTVADGDGDFIPNVFDNCFMAANGPGAGTNDQVDTDGDALGNACDPDYDQDSLVDTTDFGIFFADFLPPGLSTTGETDHDATGLPGDVVDTTDFGTFFFHFLPPGIPGPGAEG